MKLSSLILALCVGVCCCAKEYFVSMEGNDKWPGTKAKPFKTMQKAVSLVNPGDIVTVRGGVYREKVEIRCSGTAEKPIIFRGAPGETVLHTAAYPVTQAWKKTPGYRFIYESYSPYAVSMLFDSSLITRYMAVEDMKYLDKQPGAYLLDKKTGKLYVNTFSGRDPNMLNFMIVPWMGGNTEAGHGGGKTGNKIQPFSADTTELYRWLKGFIIYGKNIIVENFTFGFWPGQAVRVNAPAENVIVRNNTVFGGTCGLMLYGAVKNSKIVNNRVFRVAGTGIQLSGSGTKCLVKGNYVFNCGTCSPFKSAPEASSGNIFNIAHYGSFSYTDIIDNIVVSTDYERCGKTLMRNKGAIRRFTTQTGNVFYGGGVSLYAGEKSSALLANNTCYQGKITIGSLKTENKYTPVIKDNLFIEKGGSRDPEFADVYHRDFRLQPDSPHVGKGAFPKPGNVLYVKPDGSGSGATPAKAASLIAALKKLSGKDAVIYMLPGTYTGKAVTAGDVKIANAEGGRVIWKNGALTGKGKVTVDGIIFNDTVLQMNDSLIVKHAVFDRSKVSSKHTVFENCTFRNSNASGRITMRNSFVCGTGNTFAVAGMLSENNFFNSDKALKAFQSRVEEAHKSRFTSVKLNKDYTLPDNSPLTSAGLDCSAIGGQPVKEYDQPMQIENLQVKQISSNSVLISWDTPRHYCNVNVRARCVETKESFFGGSSNQETGLRFTGGEVVVRNLLPGKNYVFNCHFYSVRKEPMVTKSLNFRVDPNFKHKPVTLQVDPKAPGAFRTLTDALCKAGPGDTVIVGPGIYTEQVNVYLSGVTIKSRVPGKASLNVAGLFNYAIKVNGAADVTVDGFQFIGLPYSAGRKALWISQAKNFTLRNCFFHRVNSKRGGVSNIQFLGNNVDGVLVENCVFDSGFHGIWLYPAKNVTIRNCSFYGNGVNAIHVGCEQGWKTQIYNNIFQDTVSNHHTAAVTVAEHGPHIYCDYNIYWKTSRAPKQCYYAFGRHKTSRSYSAPWSVKKKNQPETLKETQRRFGVEKHAIEADPLFTDVKKADFTIKPGSPAFGKGKDGKNIGADFTIFK
ncbi:MAG: right-handed parallel beta-helix repeat-containing protein [Lentisphaeria bacterium]|nr:right-handed parallel beta-helix repeat-containing protein [Lentisphaeria bacterium]